MIAIIPGAMNKCPQSAGMIEAEISAGGEEIIEVTDHTKATVRKASIANGAGAGRVP
jgi:hypothetical protein